MQLHRTFTYILHSPDRLPMYERIFRDVVSRQAPRFSDVYCQLGDQQDEEDNEPPPIKHVKEPSFTLSSNQRRMLRDMATMSNVPDADQPVSSFMQLFYEFFRKMIFWEGNWVFRQSEDKPCEHYRLEDSENPKWEDLIFSMS